MVDICPLGRRIICKMNVKIYTIRIPLIQILVQQT